MLNDQKKHFYIVQSLIQALSKQKINFYFSAIDFHVSEIDCTLQFFKTLATDFQCNRFAWLCNRLHSQKIGNLATGTPCNRFAWLCNRLHAVWFWKNSCLTPVCSWYYFMDNFSLNLGNCSWFFYKTFLQRSLHFSLKIEPNDDDWNEEFKAKKTYLETEICALSLSCCMGCCLNLGSDDSDVT